MRSHEEPEEPRRVGVGTGRLADVMGLEEATAFFDAEDDARRYLRDTIPVVPPHRRRILMFPEPDFLDDGEL